MTTRSKWPGVTCGMTRHVRGKRRSNYSILRSCSLNRGSMNYVNGRCTQTDIISDYAALALTVVLCRLVVNTLVKKHVRYISWKSRMTVLPTLHIAARLATVLMIGVLRFNNNEASPSCYNLLTVFQLVASCRPDPPKNLTFS